MVMVRVHGRCKGLIEVKAMIKAYVRVKSPRCSTWRVGGSGEDHDEQRQGHGERGGQPDDVPQHHAHRAAHDRRQDLTACRAPSETGRRL